MSWTLAAEPRGWQREALDRWSPSTRGVASVVTGGGKTLFAYMCMLKFAETHPDARFSIVVPTTALLDQWYVGLLEDLHVHEAEVALYSGESHPKYPGKINLLVINTARRYAPAIAKGLDSFLIVDECHRAGTPINSRALRGAYGACLGLSATPVREYDEGFRELISPILGPIIYEYDYESARRDGVVAPFQLINVRVNLLPHEKAKYDQLTKRIARAFHKQTDPKAADDRLKILLQRRAAVSASAAMRLPVTTKLVEQHRGSRVIVFHERIPAANTLTRMLNQRGLNAAAYHSHLGEAIRRDNLRMFRRGLFDCLVTCRALDEGMNVPEASVAVIASATRSKRQRIQRLGRVLRPAKNKGSSTIYTIFATPPEESQLVREASRLEGVASVSWLKGKSSSHGADSSR